MMKIIKHRQKIVRNMHSFMQISAGLERLVWFSITFIVMMHLMACLWIMVGRFNEDIPVNWILVNGWTDYGNWELYICSFYWTVTTITTVGYGDISAYNNSERAFCSIAMIIGVFLYSYTIGSLSTLLLNFDSHR